MELKAGCGGGGGGFLPCRCYAGISVYRFSRSHPFTIVQYSGRCRVNRAFYLSDANWMQLLWRASLFRVAGASRVGCRQNNARRPSYRPNYTCAHGRLRFCYPLEKNLEVSRTRQARTFFIAKSERIAIHISLCCSTAILFVLFNVNKKLIL